MSVRPNICPQQRGSYWTDFHEISYQSIFRKSVDNLHVPPKPGKNSGCCTWRDAYICDNIALNSSQNVKLFRQKLQRKSEHRFYVQCVFLETGTARQATDKKVKLRMRFAHWLTKATDTHSEYVIQYLLILHGNNGYAIAPHCYVYVHCSCLF